MKRLFLGYCIVFLLSHCSSGKKEEISQSLVGQWTNETLHVVIKQEALEDSVIDVGKGKWEEVMNIKPILTTFNTDSTFSSQYFTLDGQNFHTTYGKWWIRNDSLVSSSQSGETTYYFELNENHVSFKSILDWSGDGKSDDEYQGTQVRVHP